MADDFKLPEDDSIQHFREAATAHRRALDLAEQRRSKLADTEEELRLLRTEHDRLQITVHDLRGQLAAAEVERTAAVAARVAYETFVIMLARQLGEFQPPEPPARTYRQPQPGDSPDAGRGEARPPVYPKVATPTPDRTDGAPPVRTGLWQRPQTDDDHEI
jgi:hypothetical protein